MTFDILILCDPRFPGGTSTAVAAEIRAQAAAGYSTGLLAVKGGILRHPHPYHPEIRKLLDDGACRQVDPSSTLRAGLVLVHHPQLLAQLPVQRLKFEAGMVLLVVHHPPIDGAGRPVYDIEGIERNLRVIFECPPIWAPIGPVVRRQLMGSRVALEILPFDWVNIVDAEKAMSPRQTPLGAKPIIGRHSRPDPLKWPQSREQILQVYPDTNDIEVAILGSGLFLDELMQPYPDNWQVTVFDGMPVSEFLAGIDFFVFYHHADWVEAFGRTILEALAAGCVVILSPHFEELFGDAAVYALPEDALLRVRELHADPTTFAAQSALGLRRLRERFSHARHIERLKQKLALLPSHRRVSLDRPSRPKRRVLFVTSNGIGLGHLTRMLAIARRVDPELQPVFATMSQALSIVEEAGYLAEFVPFHVYLEVPSSDWNKHLAFDLHEILAFYRPSLLMFDGNVPYQGLLDCMAQFPAMISVWCRRGFWRDNSDKALLKRDAAFDVVIEPGELAGEVDFGPTASRRDRVRTVEPIRLFDKDEILPADEARNALGLDGEKTNILLQLGSGNNQDVQGPATLVTELGRSSPDIRLVAIDNPISIEPLNLPEDVVVRSIYPLGRYLNAFDAAVSAAGYNSYHELLLSGCPSLYIPNEHPSMDDQGARARYAERRGWALAGRSSEVYELREKFLSLLQPETRAGIKRQLDKLEITNGAAEAAEIVKEYALMVRADRGQ